jgi:hypothetical protein
MFNNPKIKGYYHVTSDGLVARAYDVTLEDYKSLCRRKHIDNKEGLFDGRKMYGSLFPNDFTIATIQNEDGETWDVVSQRKDSYIKYLTTAASLEFGMIKVMEFTMLVAVHALYIRGVNALEGEIAASLN